MNTWRRLLQHPLLEPLSLAALAAWAVVWMATVRHLDAASPTHVALVHVSLWFFLAGFVLTISRSQPLPSPWGSILLWVMAAAALYVSGERNGGASPILLVLLASLIGHQLQGIRFWGALLAVNLGFASLLYLNWKLRGSALWITVAAYGSFQLFAALVISSARRAEELATSLQAINAELLTTRTLLAEAARDQERLALSRELHDVAGHSLTALKLNLGALLREQGTSESTRIELCAKLADELLQNLRGVVKAMRHEAESDIEPALRRLAAPFPRPALLLDIDTDARMLPARTFEAVLRAVQEALTNAARHGPATRLQVALRRQGGDIVLDMHDDGRAASFTQEGGGLSGMRERFEQCGGSLELKRGALGGLHLLARCPMGAT